MLLLLYDILCFHLSEYHEAIREYHKHQGINRNDAEGTNAQENYTFVHITTIAFMLPIVCKPFSHKKIMAQSKPLTYYQVTYYQGICKNELDGCIVVLTAEMLAQNRTHN